MTDKPMDLTPFCARSLFAQPWMRQPFAVADGAAATDGGMLIWAEAATGTAGELDADVPVSIPELVTAAQEAARTLDTWIPVGSLEIQANPCGTCKGRGTVTRVECDDCDGEGHFWHGAHEYECRACGGEGWNYVDPEDGDGDLPCEDCDGLGLSTSPKPVTIPGAPEDLFGNSTYLLRLRAAIPGAELAWNPRCLASKVPPINIRFPGGAGVMMPMRRGVEGRRRGKAGDSRDPD